MPPKMIVIAGPPGSGKSTLYPVDSFGIASLNADDRAAQLNSGSYIGISMSIREAVGREFEAFVYHAIQRRQSFAIETTLRSDATFTQARAARQAGFTLEMRYIVLRSFDMHMERVKIGADAGGHSASGATLRRIYDASMRDLHRALDEFDQVWVYDNSGLDASHPLVLESRGGEVCYAAEDVFTWLKLEPKPTRRSRD